MLNPYAKGGQYERFFEGRNNIDFSNDFMVIENEELKRKPDLHAVVNILLLYQITGEMYLTRNRKKVLFIDELKQQLGDIGVRRSGQGGRGRGSGAPRPQVRRRARAPRRRAPTTTTARRRWRPRFNCSDWVFLLRQKAESIEMLGRNGPHLDGRVEEAPAAARCAPSPACSPSLHLVAGRRRSRPQHPRPVQPPAVHQQAGRQRAARRAAARRATRSTTRSPSCCAAGGTRHESRSLLMPWRCRCC